MPSTSSNRERARTASTASGSGRSNRTTPPPTRRRTGRRWNGASTRSPSARRCDPDAAYLLLDGLSNGGHKHLDGNSLPRLTLFDRIWLADNDYFKAPVKFHNSITVFRDGESAAIPPYAELLAAGESPRYGYSRTRLADYAGVDWTRTIVWLKPQQAFVVLDQLTALSDDEYQFRTLWHGVGAAKLSDDGLLLTQKGPSLWIQMAPGPVLELHDDAELGANWSGYAHADPVVRSLQAVATVKLAKGDILPLRQRAARQGRWRSPNRGASTSWRAPTASGCLGPATRWTS